MRISEVARAAALFLVFASGVIALGCAPAFVVVPQAATGTYSGVTRDGGSIVVTVEQEGQVFRASGSIDGEPIALAGPMSWSAVGSLTRADGSSSLVRVGLSADSQVFTIERPGQPAMVLNRGGTVVAQPPGSLSGSYRAVQEGTLLAEATVVQNGSLISGVGVILGNTAGITGHVTAANRVEGVLTFLDESQIDFEAELSGDGRSITLRGLGAPISLRKR